MSGLRSMSWRKSFYLASAILTCSTIAGGEHIYIAQTGRGRQNGADAANARPVSWFNDARNWGVGPSLIGPGDTVHLCDTLVSGIGGNILTFRGSGTAGNPIVVIWEPKALLTSPAFGNRTNAAINTNGHSFLVLDGNGTRPSIRCTANGKTLANKNNAWGIFATPAHNCEFKNLTIENMYVQSAPADRNAFGRGIFTNGRNLTITNNRFDNMFACIDIPYNDRDSNMVISKNTLNNMNWGIYIGNNNTNTLTNVRIHENHLMNMDNWDNDNYDHHHDGIFVVQNRIDARISNIFIYNNYADGRMGKTATAWIYVNCGMNGIYIFNNILKGPTGAGFLISCGYEGDRNYYIVNNYLEGNGGNAIRTSNIRGLIFANNVLVNCYTYKFSTNVFPDSGFVDFNGYDSAGIVKNPAFKWNNPGGSPFARYLSANPTFDRNSQTFNQPMVSRTYAPVAGSKLLNTGRNLSHLHPLLHRDYAGNPRPINSANWDIGPFQVTGPLNSTEVRQSFNLLDGTQKHSAELAVMPSLQTFFPGAKVEYRNVVQPNGRKVHQLHKRNPYILVVTGNSQL